jgi:hypothetical protein
MSGHTFRLGRVLGAAAAVIGTRYMRLCPNRRLMVRRFALVAGSGVLSAAAWTTVASAATNEFMAEPISGKDCVKHKDMKSRMEALIMQVQADFCRALEKEEEDGSIDPEPKKFLVRASF